MSSFLSREIQWRIEPVGAQPSHLKGSQVRSYFTADAKEGNVTS